MTDQPIERRSSDQPPVAHATPPHQVPQCDEITEPAVTGATATEHPAPRQATVAGAAWRAPAGSASRLAIARPAALPPAAHGDPATAANLQTRRAMLRTSFWAVTGVTSSGLLLGFVNYFWPRKVGAFGGIVRVPAVDVPAPGAPPVKILEAKAWLVHLAPGTGVPSAFRDIAAPSREGGLLALYQKCPHLGCSVPWQPGFELRGAKGLFRCPCHQSTYTAAGVRVYGPAPRSMDTMAVTRNADGSVDIDTSRITRGDPGNPARAVRL